MSFLSKRASLAEQEIQRLFLHIVPGTMFEKKVFSVGGYERDIAMGKESKDLDVVVEMKGGAEKLAYFVKSLFPEETTTPRQLGATYPIWHIGFKENVTHNDKLFKTKGGEIDIADTQKESYPDPTSRQRVTEFATLPEDVQRRDFTVNMLLRDLSSGEVVDLTGSSKEDIQKGVLRGHPEVSPDKMFSEDPLRMMRLIRFQVKYDWDIPLSMIRSVRRNAEQIQKISWERIQEELIKIMKFGKTNRAIQLMKSAGLLSYILPEIYGLIGVKHDPSNHQEGDVYKHTLLVLSHAPPTIVGQLSALLHDAGKPQTQEFIDGKIRYFGHAKVSGEIAEAVLRRLKFDSGVIKIVRKIVENHMRPIDLSAASPKTLRKFVRDIGEEVMGSVLELAEADSLGTLPPKSYVPELRSKLEEAQKIPITRSPILNGEEIMNLLGIKPGPKVKEVMTYLKELEDEFAESGNVLAKETAVQKIMERFGSMQKANANRSVLSKRAIQVIVEPLDPAVQRAVQEIQRIAPETLMKVKKIVVHPSGGSGELGHVQMGPEKDPYEIHIFKSRIEQIVKQQFGIAGKQIDPKELAEAVKLALVETISHEGAHIGGAKRSEEQIEKCPFFGEGEAAAKAKEVVEREKRLALKKPAYSSKFLLSKRAGVTNEAEKLVSDVLRKIEKSHKAEEASLDLGKLNYGRKHASFVPVPISKKSVKEFGDLILEAALILDNIREKYLSEVPMAEPDLKFVIKVFHNSPDIVKLGVDLLKDDELHPISLDIENAMEFNKTAVSDLRVAKLLGIISKELDITSFDTPTFVMQLASWQDKHGITPSGKLDMKTVATFAEIDPKRGALPKNFGTVIANMVYRGGIPTLEQLENLKNNYGIQRVVSLHDNPDLARMCGILNIIHVPAFLSNGGPEDLGRKVLKDSVVEFLANMPTYVHCFYGADRTSGVIARMRTESGWPCRLAYVEAKAYGFKDMFADLIDWFSEPCTQKFIDTNAIRERMGNKEPYENPEISQDLVEPTPTDLPFETSNTGWQTYEDTIVNTFGIGSVPISEGSHGW